MVKSLQGYREQGTVRDLTPQEKGYYQTFLETTYKDNLKASDFLLVKFPRWSIISGYYTMHDISKLYLAKQFNLKFSQPEVHGAVIQTLRELVKRKDILELIEEANEEYENIISLHLSLKQGKEEREKTQYYTSETIKAEVNLQKGSYFLERLVKPYIKLVEKLMKPEKQSGF
ncbi:hypothetical protein A3K72_00420 [Candidatus Woesearchaeota archaeon RBG_13_36_6]|nr:MAG: hypothetical protein A3K72_00420 [Candidatus Woesearchaeota archaeon RBG_13_36_6]